MVIVLSFIQRKPNHPQSSSLFIRTHFSPLSHSGIMNKNYSIIGSLTSLAVLGASGFIIWKYALNSPKSVEEAQQGATNLWNEAQNISLDDFKDVLGSLDGLDFGAFFDQDPKLGDNTTYNWESDFVQPSNGGLHLTIYNALDDTWQQEFADALADWMKSPALSLTLVQVEVDHSCTRVEGVMVVCNANFGDTGWVGINENEIIGDVITSSVSKMNEYYLRNAEFDHRRYTMCHEVGHGFGLPHTDENPYNANLGNCLDYTDNPDENLYPGDVNFNKLAGMYLSSSRNRRTVTQQQQQQQSILPQDHHRRQHRRVSYRTVQTDGRIIESHALLVE